MTLLMPWMLFLLLPLLLFYTRAQLSDTKYKRRQQNFLYLSLLFMLLALSRPVLTNKPSEEKFDAEDFIIALDVSYSMQADDIKPNRYEAAKNNIAKILQKLQKDRFALFAFTSNAMLISPPTTDRQISMLALNALEPKYILTKGTSLSALFKAIAKTSYEKKNLILFSDGGEEHSLDNMINICKQNHIVPYIVAVGSSSGSILKKKGKTLKDANDNLVISRINPILKPLAAACGGKYYELNKAEDISSKIITDIKDNEYKKETKVEVKSYKELYTIPLFIALILFFLAVTKFHQIAVFIPFLFTPHQADASSLFDFYHLKEANKSYKNKHYVQSAHTFEKLTPSVASYYNAAVAYYQAKEYKKAMELFSQISSRDPQIKQKIFYNMGNCAVKLKKYDRAKIYYKKALGLGDDKDAHHNLLLLYKLQLKSKKDISDMLPKNQVNKKTGANKKENTKKQKAKNSSSSSKSQQKASQKSAGAGSKSSKQKKEQKLQKNNRENQAQYKIGYKAYELINKGYTNEKHPW